MLETIRSFFSDHNLNGGDRSVLVAVSGGVDSMTLLHGLHADSISVRCVHFNHELRGVESDEDADFVASFCNHLSIPLERIRIGDEIAMPSSERSVQAVARKVRYGHLQAIAAKWGIRYVAVGHNRDDQAETVLLNLRRGAGLDGLAGMRPVRPLGHARLIRPFLTVRRSEIVSYARMHSIPWRDDSSNSNLKYSRNRLRHVVIPQLQDLAPQCDREGDCAVEFDDDFTCDFTDEVADMAEAMAILVDQTIPALLPPELREWQQSGGRLSIEALRSLPDIVRSWLVLRATRFWLPGSPARKTTVMAVESLFSSQVGRRIQFRDGCIWRERHEVFFDSTMANKTESKPVFDGPHDSALSAGGSDEEKAVELVPGRHVMIGGRRLLLDFSKIAVDLAGSGPDSVHLDYEKIRGRLCVRPWRAGDRFIPLGMHGSQKVKTFLTDRKVKTSCRRAVQVVCDDEKIVWLVGFRIDERVRIDGESKTIAELSISTLEEVSSPAC